jgi:hypothetical protein
VVEVSQAQGDIPSARIEFREPIWDEEVGRLRQQSPARAQAQRARREIEEGRTALFWLRCAAEGSDGTALPGCRKLYVPLDAAGTSAAPFGLIFRLTRTPTGLAWVMIAFGERHPDNARTRSVYERAHRRLHGRYP